MSLYWFTTKNIKVIDCGTFVNINPMENISELLSKSVYVSNH